MSTKKERMYERIENHGRQLLTIFPDAVESDPVKLCKKLLRIENEAHRLATDYCNGAIETDDWEGVTQKILRRVVKVLKPKLGFGLAGSLVVNGDCRGYALKIHDAAMRDQNLNLYRDWGGYGILAPDFSREVQ